MKSVVSSKGQITLPAAAREKLGLLPGTPVQFELRQGGLDVLGADPRFGEKSRGPCVLRTMAGARGVQRDVNT